MLHPLAFSTLRLISVAVLTKRFSPGYDSYESGYCNEDDTLAGPFFPLAEDKTGRAGKSSLAWGLARGRQGGADRLGQALQKRFLGSHQGIVSITCQRLLLGKTV